MNRKALVLSAVAGLLAPTLAGCGAVGGGSGSGDPIVVGTTDQVEASKEAPAPLDPAYTYDTSTWNILRQTIQTLMTVPRGGGTPVPDAARNCSFTDSQDESYRCKLRSGLKFANGDPVTPADVKYSIMRVINIDDPNSAVGLLSNIDTIETSGDSDVVFNLKTPDATFPYKLATPIAGVVNPKDYPAKKLRNGFRIDGSGPYTFKANVKGDKVIDATFTRNPTYKGSLKLQNSKVDLKMFPSSESMGTALDKSQIDVILRTLSPQQIIDMQAHPKPGEELTEVPGQEIRYLAFDTDAPVVREKAVRQAMASVINRGELVQKVYRSIYDPLYSIIPTGITGHTNSFFDKYGDGDTAEAAKYLEDAGISTPVKLTLNYTTDHYGDSTAGEFENLKQQLDSSGLFDITIKGEPWATFLPKQTEAKFPAYGLGWFPDFPDGDNYIAPFLDKDNTLNTPYVSKEAQDVLIPEERRQANRGAASATFAKLQDIIADDVPLIPLWQGNEYIASRDDVAGVENALDSSSSLHLWELSRSTGGTN